MVCATGKVDGIMNTRTNSPPPHAEFFPPAAPLRSDRPRFFRLHSDFAELARVWPVILNMVSQELRVRYQRSVLGFVWSLLNPILMMVTMAVVFTRLLGRNDPRYVLYLFSGLVPWLFLSGSLTDAAFCIIQNEGLIRKIYIPKLVFPVSRVLVNLVNFLLTLLALFLLLIPLGAKFSWAMLFLPVTIVLYTALVLGLGVGLAILNTFYRDCGHLIGVVLQAWYFATPILYSTADLPTIPLFIKLNPVYPFIAQFQAIIRWGELPSMAHIGASVLIAMLCLGTSYVGFKAHEDKLIFRL
jgi:ABC-2 type transport system permease protein/lipopolysaccharide transport system permease protein